MANSSTGLCLLYSSYSSDRSFASNFLQIPPRGGHPCLQLVVGTINPHIRLSLISKYSCQANHKEKTSGVPLVFYLESYLFLSCFYSSFTFLLLEHKLFQDACMIDNVLQHLLLLFQRDLLQGQGMFSLRKQNGPH